MRFDLFTLFPEICAAYLQESILKRAQEAGLIEVSLHNIRDHAAGKHRVTDDLPYGGGGGMVMKPEPVFAAVESVLGDAPARERIPIILLTPQGRPFTQAVAQALSQQPRLALDADPCLGPARTASRAGGQDHQGRNSRARLIHAQLPSKLVMSGGGDLISTKVVSSIAITLWGVSAGWRHESPGPSR